VAWSAAERQLDRSSASDGALSMPVAGGLRSPRGKLHLAVTQPPSTCRKESLPGHDVRRQLGSEIGERQPISPETSTPFEDVCISSEVAETLGVTGRAEAGQHSAQPGRNRSKRLAVVDMGNFLCAG
jgi:hypothetical protein